MPATTHPPKARFSAAVRQIETGRFEAARTALTALALELPRMPEIPYQLSRVAGYLGDPAGRAAHVDRALRLKPEEPALIDAAIAAHTLTGDVDTVLALHDRRAKVMPKPLHAKADKAVYLQSLGRFEAAEDLLRGLIARHPKEGALYRTLFSTMTVAPADPLMARLRRLLADRQVPDDSRSHASFAMAKALEDQGAHGEVFAHLHRANAIQRSAAPYDRDGQDRERRAFRSAQEGADLTPIPARDEAPAPIFVIGMPRSGTTLAESVIAAHPGVQAGGELAHALRLVWDGFVRGARVAPLAQVREADLAALARTYRARVRFDAGVATGAVTDKSIQSHMVLGFLARALPDARFVAIRRDPRDVALSIYKNHFRTGTHRYATDLADIAHAIRAHRDSIARWRDRLPDRVTEIAYEDLVSDPEPTARALLAAAGLDWHPACIDFHAQQTRVRTLSVAQVRQPIHAGRRAAWRRYEADLAPFFDAWGDASWD